MSLTGDVYAMELLVFPNDNPMAHRSAFSGETPLVSSLMALLNVNTAGIHKELAERRISTKATRRDFVFGFFSRGRAGII